MCLLEVKLFKRLDDCQRVSKSSDGGQRRRRCPRSPSAGRAAVMAGPAAWTTLRGSWRCAGAQRVLHRCGTWPFRGNHSKMSRHLGVFMTLWDAFGD